MVKKKKRKKKTEKLWQGQGDKRDKSKKKYVRKKTVTNTHHFNQPCLLHPAAQYLHGER